MQTDDISLKEIRNRYGSTFPKSSPHHLIPSSRNGPTSHFNLYPYKRSAHAAYHDLFWNMGINEVWENLDNIYSAIFESNDEFIYPFWFEFCELERGSEDQKARFYADKKIRLSKKMRTIKLQEFWFRAFGSTSLGQARNLLKYMMLFMIFGINMINPESIYNNKDLVSFFNTYPVDGHRTWAFEVCFGKNGVGIHCIKSKTSKIVRRVRGWH